MNGERFISLGLRMLAVGVVAGALAPPAAAAANDSWTALMVNDLNFSDSVTPIDVSTDAPAPAIPAGNVPFAIAVSPDGTKAYIADFNSNHAPGADGVTAVDLAQSPPQTSLISTDPHGGGTVQPLWVALTPDGTMLYAAAAGQGKLEKIDLTTDPPTAGAPFGDGTNDGADSIAISPGGGTGWVTDQVEGQVTPIDLATNQPGSPIAIGSGSGGDCGAGGSGAWPLGIAVSPDGSKVFVADIGTSQLSIINTANDAVTNVNLPAHGGAYDIAVAPDGATVYVTQPCADDVVPVTVTGTPAAGTPIPVPFSSDPANPAPMAIAITPDGSRLYVGDGNGTQAVDVPLPSGTPQTAISTGQQVRGGVVSPDQAPVANFTVAPAPAGQPTSFDASSSTVAVGTIARYDWNFGDGATAETSTPATAHTYAASGNYTASVTETDSAGTSTTQVFTGASMLLNGGPSAHASKSVVVSAAPQPAVQLSASSLSFGAITVGDTSDAQTVTVTNTGQAGLVISHVAVSGAAADDFALSNDTCSGHTVASGSRCGVEVSFSPTAGGARSAILAFDDNASGSPHTLELSGTGSTVAQLHGTVTAAGGAGVPAASVQICPQGMVSGGKCRVTSTDGSGAYAFDQLSPGPWAMQVEPQSAKLFGGSALVQIRPGDQSQDFELKPPGSLSDTGVTFNTPDGAVSSGVPVVNWDQPFSFQVPVHIPLTGPPNAYRPMAVVAGLGDTGGGFELGGIMMYAVYYDKDGNASGLSPALVGQLGCNTPSGASACATLASELSSGATPAATDIHRAAARGAAPGAVATAASGPCVGPGLQARPNDFGGVDFTITWPDGTQTTVPIVQAQIPTPPPTGNPYADVALNLLVSGVNTAVNLNPAVGTYNFWVGVVNSAAQLTQENSTGTSQTLAAGNLALQVAAQALNRQTHGALGYWFGNIWGGTISGLAGQKNPPPPPPKPPCPPKGGGPVYVDPSGSVLTTGSAPVARAKVVLSRSASRTGHQTKVPNGSATMSPLNRHNPDDTSLLGTFGWDVLPGYYRVAASHPGCHAGKGGAAAARSPLIAVPPPATNLVLRLRCPHLRRAPTAIALTARAGFEHKPGTSLSAKVTSLARGGRAARRAALVGWVTFSAGGRQLGAVAVDTRTGVATLDVATRTRARVHARYSGNGLLAPAEASAHS